MGCELEIVAKLKEFICLAMAVGVGAITYTTTKMDEAALAKVLAIAPACLRRTDTTRPKTIMFAMYMYAATGIDAVSSTPCCVYIRGRRACLCGSCHVCGMPSCRAGPPIIR